MAYTVPAGAVLEVQHRYKLQGQQCINVYHYEAEAEIPDAGAQLPFLASDFFTTVANVIQGYQTTEVVETRIRAQWVSPLRYVYHEDTTVDPAGTQAPPTVSIGTCLICRRMSERATRSARGRVYIGGLAQSYLTIGTWNNTLTAAIRTAIQNAVAAPLSGDAITVYPVIWSYQDTANKDRVVTTLVDPYARYQRRREVGRGE